MTAQEKNQQIEARFQAVREHLTHANPNDFDGQIPPNFVSCDWENKTITYFFDMEPRFGNPHGMGHGGIVTAMLDCAQGSAIDCFSDDHPIIVTVSLETSYLRPVRLGEKLYVKVTIQKRGNTLAYCVAEAWQTPGELAVTTAGVYHLSPRPEPV